MTKYYQLASENRSHFWHRGIRPKHPDVIRAVKAGEFRAPKKGEWFLSGAIPEAYLTYNDLTTKYHIAKIVIVKEVKGYQHVATIPQKKYYASCGQDTEQHAWIDAETVASRFWQDFPSFQGSIHKFVEYLDHQKIIGGIKIEYPDYKRGE